MIVNDGIRAREVRLIDQNGEQLGIKSKREALQLAAAREGGRFNAGNGAIRGNCYALECLAPFESAVANRGD